MLVTITCYCIIITCVWVFIKSLITIYKNYRFQKYQHERLEELKKIANIGKLIIEEKEENEK